LICPAAAVSLLQMLELAAFNFPERASVDNEAKSTPDYLT
jgi:hypothetical protein